MKVSGLFFSLLFVLAAFFGSASDAQQLETAPRFESHTCGGLPCSGGGTWTYGPFTLVGTSTGAAPLIVTNNTSTHLQVWTCGLTGTPPSGCQINLQSGTSDPLPGQWSPTGNVPPGGTVWCKSPRGQQVRCFARTAVQS